MDNKPPLSYLTNVMTSDDMNSNCIDRVIPEYFGLSPEMANNNWHSSKHCFWFVLFCFDLSYATGKHIAGQSKLYTDQEKTYLVIYRYDTCF